MSLYLSIFKYMGTLREQKLLEYALSMQPGTRLGLMGLSGSGKTTLLRMIAGLLKPDGGYIKWGEQVWYDHHRCVSPSQRRVGLMFQHHALFPHMTVEANIRYGAVQGGEIESLLQIGGLMNRRSVFPAQLSGGERQRVALLRTLAARPELLLLDEPLNALDERTKTDLQEWLQELLTQWNVTAIMVSHDARELETLCTQICTIEDLQRSFQEETSMQGPLKIQTPLITNRVMSGAHEYQQT